MKLTQKQFYLLEDYVEAVAELEARKVHCEMTDDDYEAESLKANRLRNELYESIVDDKETST